MDSLKTGSISMIENINFEFHFSSAFVVFSNFLHQFLTVAQSFQRTPSAQNVRWITLCCTVVAGTGAGQLLDGFNEIFPITKQPFLGLFIQEAVTFSSDQQVICSIISDNIPAMYVTSLAATNAAISSNLGIVTRFIRVTRYFDITNQNIPRPQKPFLSIQRLHMRLQMHC
ncbi:hypothetical protein T12_5713 [Trichinella patagoniensis]|uniref:Uncharacterized protein n=1 Tax=Trichinella patagoniensis TaxID=990121 RepID=A0A0V1A7J0_9BILA|nr:hypothetical protein T12_5713 [Trichinella patagoniensis]